MYCWPKGAASLPRCCPLTDSSGDNTAKAEDFAFCREIARRANANLLHAARLLPGPRQDFFFATYAAMRLIDDAVDDGFLCRPVADREHERGAMLADIDNWQGQCLGETEEGPLPEPVFRALQTTAHCSDLGETPWTGLADAMRCDVREQPMPDWEDFLGYAAGATVAPATIFIYLLGAKPAERGFSWDLPEPPVHYAADLGIFCYLVHILRDLAKDAERSERLVTVPDSLIEHAGLQKAGLTDAIRSRDPRVGALAADLRQRASSHLEAGRIALRALNPLIGRREQLALSGLIGIYETLFDRFSADYFAGMADAPALELALRKKLLPSQAPS